MASDGDALARWSEGRTGRALLASIAGLEPHRFRFALLDGTSTNTLLWQVPEAAHRWMEGAGSVSDATIFATASEFVNSYAHGLESEWRGFDDILADAQNSLTEIALDISRRTGLRWWTESISVQHQFAYLRRGRSGAHTTENALVKAEGPVLDGSTWWVSPAGVLVSSRGPVLGFPCVIAAAPDDHWMKDKRDSLWAVEVSGRATVFEIHGKEDWAQLVAAYPRNGQGFLTFDWGPPPSQGTNLLLPDRRRAALDWDAVHVSFAGYLAASYEPIPVDESHYTVLAGWHPDATYWLTGQARAVNQVHG
ncbi:hypothetical protein J2S89_004063 [Arthrobacter bambusae]|nr:hypothetical protein [Arthrobacter bambusae]MDQ0100324.1 hypothetical protein [Arthrobacter bambusae]